MSLKKENGETVHYLLSKDIRWISNLEDEIKEDHTKNLITDPKLPIIKLPDQINLSNAYLAFSTTALLNAIELPEASIGDQARGIFSEIIKKIDPRCKINCHVFSMTHKYGIIETGRAELIKDKLTTLLKKEKRFYLRKGFDRSLPFIQVLVLADRSVVLSILNEKEMNTYRSLISPFVGGFNNVADDKKAPSRAFKKIVEAMEIMGHTCTEDETLIDLGACPGGWSYIARKQGAKVIALDRSELREDLMDDPGVIFLQEDAFKYVPTEKIHWAVSDIISTPERVLELVEFWVSQKNCEKFIFTIKFKGDGNYSMLKNFKQLAPKTDYHVILKQLNANKNEVTIMGWLK